MKHFIFGLTLLTLLVVIGCTSSSENTHEEESSQNCAEPQNPYDEGTGHYAGYEWAETNTPGNCGGRSQSFIEGCEEYQESKYEDCEARNRK